MVASIDTGVRHTHEAMREHYRPGDHSWLDAEGEQALKRNQCLPDRLMPEDIARMVLFLASDDARMCTAQEFTVDAGWT